MKTKVKCQTLTFLGLKQKQLNLVPIKPPEKQLIKNAS